VFPQDEDKGQPMWDSGVRKALKLAAAAEGCDFLGLGPHSLRRANITWSQGVGGSSIETSQIAGHANTKITEEYTVVQLRRQEELTRRIQSKRQKAAQRSKACANQGRRNRSLATADTCPRARLFIQPFSHPPHICPGMVGLLIGKNHFCRATTTLKNSRRSRA